MATGTERRITSGLEVAKTGAKSLQEFFNKFNNDWVMTFAAALAFNLITAILPILIAILAVVGFTIGNLSPYAHQQLLMHLQDIFPSSGNFLTLASDSLQRSAGFLIIIAVLLAIFGGSRLFVSIEGYFDVIYHTRPRGIIRQNVMAVVMLLIFIVLTVPMVFAASIPAALQVLVQQTPLGQFPGNGFIFGLLGIVISLLISWVLFEAIYIVVPNQHISFRNSWFGAVVAAVLLQIYLLLFPLYVTHFLGSYTGNIALAVVLLFFFYYFAVILLIGAEINAFFAENVRATPDNIAVMIHKLTSHLPTSEKDMQEQATPTHKGEEPKDIRPKSQAEAQSQANSAPVNTPGGTPGQVQMKSLDHNELTAHTNHQAKKQKSRSVKAGTPGALVVAETLAGTVFAFIVELYQIRHKK